MIVAFTRSLAQLGDPRIFRILARAVVLAAVLFALLIVGTAALLRWTAFTDLSAVEWIIDLLGAVLPFVAALFLFPVVAQLLLGFFLEDVAVAVEQRHYPELPAAKGVGIFAGLGASLRFLLKALVINLALLFLLAVPAVYPIAWLLCNAYLIGREYFELVALRRIPSAEARELRRRHRFAALIGGLGGMALFAIPVVNFVAPVILTMVMVHACQRWLRAAPAAA